MLAERLQDAIPEREGETEESKATSKRTPSFSKPDDIEQQTWDDWCQLRKAKKATVTQTVLNGARNEAGKAGVTLEEFLQIWCRRGSQGLEASWLRTDEKLPQSGGIMPGAI